MEVILLERIESLGKMGDTVTVKPGYARNYLLPRKKALRVTESNLEFFEKQRAGLEKENQAKHAEAQKQAKKLDKIKLTVLRQAGESGHLYGSVNARDVAEAMATEGYKINRDQVKIDKPVKSLGVFPMRIALHPELDVTIYVNVARTEEEAKAQAASGLIGAAVKATEEDEKPEIVAEAFFEEGAAPKTDEESEESEEQEENAGE